MVVTVIKVTNTVGLHARPASLFVQTANKYNSKINVKNVSTSGESVDAKSIISILTLGVLKNHEILIEADGEDEVEAVQALTTLVNTNFGES